MQILKSSIVPFIFLWEIYQLLILVMENREKVQSLPLFGPIQKVFIILLFTHPPREYQYLRKCWHPIQKVVVDILIF